MNARRPASRPVESRPNVLFIMVDQWAGHLLGCAGHPVIETPTLDRLAAVGTRYTRCYAETPVCIPARRTVMTGTSPRRHGDRDFQSGLPMPADLPTLAECFVAAGYQAFAVGKLHVYPPRNRIGFGDVLLCEEGRGHLNRPDDYEIFLADEGHAGQQFLHGMSNNEYGWRPWHLPESCHVTNWTTLNAARMIRRRDTSKPALWYVSYTHPHPPIVPLQSYLDRYRERSVPDALEAEWAGDETALPWALRQRRRGWPPLPPDQLADMRRAFYALCTHIDHQIRILIGTLREEHLLDDTILCFTSDHGDMLGDNGLYAKRLMYEGSANVPLIVVPPADSPGSTPGTVDDRLVGLQDVMPTLLDLAGVGVPATCEGRNIVAGPRRDVLYGEVQSDERATRMIHDGRHKLIWYPAGNRVQLFDLEEDPQELDDLAGNDAVADVRARLEDRLVEHLYGADEAWISDGVLVGTAEPDDRPVDNRGLSGQRGLHFPPVPPTEPNITSGV